MDTACLNRVLIAAMLSFTCSALFAQKATNNTIWKKEISRDIEIAPVLKDKPNDITLFEMLIKGVSSGKLTAYSNNDQDFSTKLTPGQFNALVFPRPDTVTITDPVTGKETMRIVQHDPDYTVVHRYRILETWTFNAVTCKTEIQVTGIAPMMSIVNEGGSFRGYLPMFWVRFNNANPILAHYQQSHPGNSIAAHPGRLFQRR